MLFESKICELAESGLCLSIVSARCSHPGACVESQRQSHDQSPQPDKPSILKPIARIQFYIYLHNSEFEKVPPLIAHIPTPRSSADARTAHRGRLSHAIGNGIVARLKES